MKRFIFHALDQYTLKTFGRKEWEAGVRHGVECEQQRIIKLLKHEYLEMESLEYEHFENICVTCENIALIKGEK